MAITAQLSDEQIIEMWLRDRSPHTVRNYRRVSESFLDLTGKGIREITHNDLSAYAELISDYSEGTQENYLDVVKSLLSYAHNLGCLEFNVGRAFRTKPWYRQIDRKVVTGIPNELLVRDMIEQEPNDRNRMILILFYYTGCTVSELGQLRWQDVLPDTDGGYLMVGSGAKRRAVALPDSIRDELIYEREDHNPDAFIFKSRKRNNLRDGALSGVQLRDIVIAASKRIDESLHVTPRALRHAHAKHALEHGAPAEAVAQTLGFTTTNMLFRYLRMDPGDSSGSYLFTI